MKKIVFILFSLLLLICPICISENISSPVQIVCAADNEIENEITDNIKDQLTDLDFGNIDEIIGKLEQQGQSIFGNKSFIEKVYLILSGEYSEDFSSIWKALIALFFDDILSFLPIIATIIAVAILGGMISNLRPKTNGKSLGNIIHFVIYGVILLLLSSVIVRMISLTANTLHSIQQQMEIVFPILLTLLTAIGGTVSVSVYQPAVAMLSSSIIGIFSNILMPIFLISLALSFVSNLSTSLKLDKMVSFLNSSFKWIIGLIFTVFTGFMTIQGITAGSVDGLSIKTAKYTIKSYIPIVGGYLSDGLFLVLAASNLIKNAVGGAGLLLLLATIISPIVQLIIFMLALKLIAGIIEPMGDSRIASFISSVSKAMVMLIVMLLCVSFMYVVLVGLVMCSANIV